MNKLAGHFLWGAIAIAAAYALAGIAFNRGESVNSMWLVVASVCVYLIGFRFYAKFIAAKVMALNDQRATPAERLRNGHDYEPTNKWILFGHHFAAIAGPGPLVQFGCRPGTCGMKHCRRRRGESIWWPTTQRPENLRGTRGSDGSRMLRRLICWMGTSM